MLKDHKGKNHNLFSMLESNSTWVSAIKKIAVSEIFVQTTNFQFLFHCLTYT